MKPFSLEPDEAVLSPAGAPGVLDQPEVLASLTAVANNSHSMVDVAPVGSLATPVVVVDAAAVVEHVGSVDGGADRVHVDHLLHVGLVRAPAAVDSGDLGGAVVAGVVVSAEAVSGGVGVAALHLQEPVILVLDPLHVGDHEATVTASVAIAVTVGAVHHVLLGQVVDEVAGDLPEAGVDGGHGCEDSAGATGGLVLD